MILLVIMLGLSSLRGALVAEGMFVGAWLWVVLSALWEMFLAGDSMHGRYNGSHRKESTSCASETWT